MNEMPTPLIARQERRAATNPNRLGTAEKEIREFAKADSRMVEPSEGWLSEIKPHRSTFCRRLGNWRVER